MHTYCVILRLQRSVVARYWHTKRYYLRAKSATQAALIASEDPEWFVYGIEPARMSAASMQNDRSETWHVA